MSHNDSASSPPPPPRDVGDPGACRGHSTSPRVSLRYKGCSDIRTRRGMTAVGSGETCRRDYPDELGASCILRGGIV